MNEIVFYLPKHTSREGAFGCATLSLAGMPDCAPDAAHRFGFAPEGVVLNGTYEEILAGIPAKDYKAAIVLCGNAGGENAFVRQLSQKLSCPIVGGGAAMDGNIGGLITGGGQASVLLIDDETCDVVVETKNIHQHIIETVKVGFDPKNPRIVRTIDGVTAKDWLDRQKQLWGFSVNDFESFTLSDLQGVNAHLSFDGQHVRSGRDLTTEMIARYVKPEEVYPAVLDFYNDDENTIIFGCAGLKSITGELPKINSLGLYLFGEICTTEYGPEFGNLMLSKIRFVR